MFRKFLFALPALIFSTVALADFSGPTTTYTGVVQGGPPLVISASDARIGIVCDGATDEAAKWTTAFALAGAGGTIVAPPNSTCVSGGATASQNALHIIFPYGTTLTRPNNATNPAFTFTGVNQVFDGGGTIDGNASGVTSGSTVFINGAAGANGTTIRDLIIQNTKSYGVLADDVPNLTIQNTRALSGIGDIAILDQILGSSDIPNNRVIGNTCDRSAAGSAVNGDCIHVTTSVNGKYFVQAQVSLNQAKGHVSPSAHDSCIVVKGFKNSVVSNNTTDGCYLGLSTGGITGGLVNTTISGNTIFEAANYGLEINNATSGSATGNTIDGNGITLNGIEAENTTGKFSIVGNQFTNVTGAGIEAVGGTDVVVAGNVGTVLPVGVRLSGVSQFSITGNDLNGAGTGSPAAQLLNSWNGAVTGNNFTGWGNGVALNGNTTETIDQIAVNGNNFTTVTNPISQNLSGGAALGSHIKAIGNSGLLDYSDYANGVTIDAGNLLVTPPGRLTFTTGTPVMTSDVSAATTIYYDSFNGQYVPTFDGTNWNLLKIAANEISMGLAAANVLSGSVYDIFGISNAGALALCVGPAWSSSTSRGTGAGTTQLSRPNGILSNAVSLTHCYGGAAGTTDYGPIDAAQGTWLGSVLATANGQSQFNGTPASAVGGSIAGGNVMGLCNGYNQVLATSASRDSNSWTNTSSTFAVADIGATGSGLNNRVEWLNCQLASPPIATETVQNSNVGTFGNIGLVLDATTGAPSVAALNNDVNSTAVPYQYIGSPALGVHYLQAMEKSGTNTFTATYSNLVISVRVPM